MVGTMGGRIGRKGRSGRRRGGGHVRFVWGRQVLLALVLALAVPVPSAAVALFTPGAAQAAFPLSAPEREWLHARVDGRSLPDPRTASPADVAAFFARLTVADAASLAERFPSVVGNLDGVPIALRYAANDRTLRGSGERFAPWASEGRQVLAFDPRSGGRVAEVFGDLASADRIAVVVPGVGTTAYNFDRSSPAHPYRPVRVAGQELYRQMRADAPGARVAVVSWLGYRPPADLGRGAAREELARTGAQALTRFTEGLVATRPGASVALIGHSYGSVVAGLAARRLPAAVSDIAVVGSPGMGADRVRDLHTSARVWAGCATGDWIQDVPDVQVLGVGHGTAPVDPEFGARVFSTAGVRAHDEYFRPGTASLRNLAAIALGRAGSVR